MEGEPCFDHLISPQMDSFLLVFTLISFINQVTEAITNSDDKQGATLHFIKAHLHEVSGNLAGREVPVRILSALLTLSSTSIMKRILPRKLSRTLSNKQSRQVKTKESSLQEKPVPVSSLLHHLFPSSYLTSLSLSQSIDS